MTKRVDITDELERHAKLVMPNYPNDVCSRAKAEIERLRATLKGIAEFCSGDGRPLGAIERLATIQNTADRAVRAFEQQGDGK